MQICLKPAGAMKHELNILSGFIELPDNSKLKDLLSGINTKWGDELPESLWNKQRVAFRGPVFLISKDHLLKNPEEPLTNNQEIEIRKVLVGG